MSRVGAWVVSPRLFSEISFRSGQICLVGGPSGSVVVLWSRLVLPAVACAVDEVNLRSR